ncbi:hypothetical protein [Actinomadura parmotrematis]|uniref:DUF4333 domain-containing protein n=1 Tax=Actinomadura parmotrematis TaxID=2864039 RepID=A0ABS7G529_9ACTN|nr:hypothetical protein [Actinomadura parmotrematis]MBW8487335.1 hypothetical protein [Actinomadura parmotrematis]
MKSKPLLALAGAVGGTILATAGVAAFLAANGDDGATPVASARSQQDTKQIAAALRAAGADSCDADATRVECRYEGRYVAATVVTADMGLTMETAVQSWRTGVGQSALGDDAAFALLQGPNWLVTGPDGLVDGVRPKLGGSLLHCDRPYGTCK